MVKSTFGVILRWWGHWNNHNWWKCLVIRMITLWFKCRLHGVDLWVYYMPLWLTLDKSRKTKTSYPKYVLISVSNGSHHQVIIIQYHSWTSHSRFIHEVLLYHQYEEIGGRLQIETEQTEQTQCSFDSWINWFLNLEVWNLIRQEE